MSSVCLMEADSSVSYSLFFFILISGLGRTYALAFGERGARVVGECRINVLALLLTVDFHFLLHIYSRVPL